MINIKPATSELLKEFYGYIPKKTFRGFVSVEDGKPVIIAGLYIEKSRLILFGEISPDINRTEYRYIKQAILLQRKIHKLMERYYLPVCALADPSIPNSDELLVHFGFDHVIGGVYQWQQQYPI